MGQEDVSWYDSGMVDRGQCGLWNAVTTWGACGTMGLKCCVGMRGAASVEGDMRWGCVSQ